MCLHYDNFFRLRFFLMDWRGFYVDLLVHVHLLILLLLYFLDLGLRLNIIRGCFLL